MASYRLLETVGGVTHFAMVEVNVVSPGANPDAVAVEGRASTPSEWVAAAAEGLGDARHVLDAYPGVPDAALRSFVVAKIRGTLVDTRPDTVRVVATLAALAAAGVPVAELPNPAIVHDRWALDYRQYRGGQNE